jgi:hypothetical protein
MSSFCEPSRDAVLLRAQSKENLLGCGLLLPAPALTFSHSGVTPGQTSGLASSSSAIARCVVRGGSAGEVCATRT